MACVDIMNVQHIGQTPVHLWMTVFWREIIVFMLMDVSAHTDSDNHQPPHEVTKVGQGLWTEVHLLLYWSVSTPIKTVHELKVSLVLKEVLNIFFYFFLSFKDWRIYGFIYRHFVCAAVYKVHFIARCLWTGRFWIFTFLFVILLFPVWILSLFLCLFQVQKTFYTRLCYSYKLCYSSRFNINP